MQYEIGAPPARLSISRAAYERGYVWAKDLALRYGNDEVTKFRARLVGEPQTSYDCGVLDALDGKEMMP